MSLSRRQTRVWFARTGRLRRPVRVRGSVRNGRPVRYLMHPHPGLCSFPARQQNGEHVSESGIRLLGVSGSPRFEATHHAVNEALTYARDNYGAEVYYFSVRGKTIDFCVHCDHCIRKKQGCARKDDVVDLYPRMQWAHAWILGSPCYQGQISAQLKAVLDRCRALVAQDPKVFKNKVGMGIAVGGDRTGGQELVLHSMIDFYLINEMIPVGGGSFGANLGGALWSKDKGAEGARADHDGLASIRRSVDRLIEVARAFHG